MKQKNEKWNEYYGQSTYTLFDAGFGDLLDREAKELERLEKDQNKSKV